MVLVSHDRFLLTSVCDDFYLVDAKQVQPFDGDLDEYGWHAGNSGASTREVGLKKSNNWDLYDMYGLVAEWCEDNYRKDYSIKSTQLPYVDETDMFCHRGGSWFTESDSTRSSSRGHSICTKSSDGIGLRLVWEPN